MEGYCFFSSSYFPSFFFSFVLLVLFLSYSLMLTNARTGACAEEVQLCQTESVWETQPNNSLLILIERENLFILVNVDDHRRSPGGDAAKSTGVSSNWNRSDFGLLQPFNSIKEPIAITLEFNDNIFIIQLASTGRMTPCLLHLRLLFFWVINPRCCNSFTNHKCHNASVLSNRSRRTMANAYLTMTPAAQNASVSFLSHRNMIFWNDEISALLAWEQAWKYVSLESFSVAVLFFALSSSVSPVPFIRFGHKMTRRAQMLRQQIYSNDFIISHCHYECKRMCCWWMCNLSPGSGAAASVTDHFPKEHSAKGKRCCCLVFLLSIFCLLFFFSEWHFNIVCFSRSIKTL